MTKKFVSLVSLASLLLTLVPILSLSAEMQQTAPTAHKYIKVKALRARLLKGHKITILDARSTFAYGKEHIQDAVSLPLAEIRSRVGSFPFSKPDMVVTYCSCPHHIAEMAADVLKDLGYANVFVLDEGIPGWKKLGYPLSGELANKPVTIFWVAGYVHGPFHKPMPNVEVRVYQASTDQLEIDKTGKDGFYAMPLRFYGLQPGDQLQASLGGDTVFFSVGEKTTPWGIRIDDEESHVVLRENDFLKTFKSHKLHI